VRPHHRFPGSLQLRRTALGQTRAGRRPGRLDKYDVELLLP